MFIPFVFLLRLANHIRAKIKVNPSAIWFPLWDSNWKNYLFQSNCLREKNIFNFFSTPFLPLFTLFTRVVYHSAP